MKHNLKLKEKAIYLRKNGFSFSEISKKLNISKSTASLWLRDVILSPKAKGRISSLRDLGRKKAIETKNKKISEIEIEIDKRVEKYLKCLKFTEDHLKIVCALLYWCEGEKNGNAVVFINSDPEMIKYFLYTFRKSFKLKEEKFRVLVHLHEYHNKEKQLKFWSETTDIPITQFFNPYLKKNSGKNIRKNYPGCVSIRYYDITIFKELTKIYKEVVLI